MSAGCLRHIPTAMKHWCAVTCCRGRRPRPVSSVCTSLRPVMRRPPSGPRRVWPGYRRPTCCCWAWVTTGIAPRCFPAAPDLAEALREDCPRAAAAAARAECAGRAPELDLAPPARRAPGAAGHSGPAQAGDVGPCPATGAGRGAADSRTAAPAVAESTGARSPNAIRVSRRLRPRIASGLQGSPGIPSPVYGRGALCQRSPSPPAGRGEPVARMQSAMG